MYARISLRVVFYGLGLLVLLVGCATITKGIYQDLNVYSEPTNASVMLSTGERCPSTPCTFRILRRNSFSVSVLKDGCKTEIVQIRPLPSESRKAAWAGNLLLAAIPVLGIPGVTVDVASGAINDLTPNPVRVKLQCAS